MGGYAAPGAGRALDGARDRMSADWNELTLQEKKAGMSTFFASWKRGRWQNAHIVLGWSNAV